MTAREADPSTGLFGDLPEEVSLTEEGRYAGCAPGVPCLTRAHYLPVVDDDLIELFRRARDPSNPIELRDLYLDRVECQLTGGRGDGHRAERWRHSKPLRPFDADEILSSRAGVRAIKELFNHFFRDDLYGRLRNDTTVILSSGAVCEETFGLPTSAKAAVRYALQRDWYGYSDSRGRVSARAAVALLESRRIGHDYSDKNIALTMGATFAVNALADFILTGTPPTQPVLCAIPNYPPLVENIARRAAVRLVPLPSTDGQVALGPLIDQLRPDTPMVFLQTVFNPTGGLASESDLDRLIDTASPRTLIVLDECHEFLGNRISRSRSRGRRNVIRVNSFSKTWSAPGMKLGWIVADQSIIDDYYEFASSTYGGPPSLFYTLIETLARFERWSEEGIVSPGPGERAEFGEGYEIAENNLERAFLSYVTERAEREQALLRNRAAFLHGLSERGFPVHMPSHSINAAVFDPGHGDSYTAFRELMATNNIAVYPGILNFCFSDALLRVTYSRRWDDLQTALDRLSRDARSAGLGVRKESILDQSHCSLLDRF